MLSKLKAIKMITCDLIDQLKLKFLNVSEGKMTIHWIWLGVTWIFVFFMLLSLINASQIIAWVGVSFLAFHVTSWIHHAVSSARPKTLIKQTQGKTVFITGCDTGFGHHLALKLDQLGFKVFAGCLFSQGEGATILRQHASEALQVVSIDVTNGESVKEAYQIVKEHLDETNNRLWALVNNAGIATITEIEWCPVELYQQMFEVNSLGMIRVTKAFLPLLRRQPENRIVIVASLAGRYTFAGFSAYSMSKHAAVSFADGLRREMKKWNLSVHTVEPTLYKTPLTDVSRLQGTLEKLWEQCPDHVRRSYGREYLEDFKTSLQKQVQRGKPQEKIHEVIDDMVHAVAGEQPKALT